MNKDFWIRPSFYFNSEGKKTIDFLCPNCQAGKLQVSKDSFHYEETLDSLQGKKELGSDWEYGFTRFRFTGTLRCGTCNDTVCFLGDGSPVAYYDDATFSSGYLHQFYPEFFHPTVHMFQISAACPENIKQEIIKCFSLYLVDAASCANKIRIVVELIMDQQKIKKWQKIKGQNKEVRLTLHKRIELFQEKKPEIGKHLMAIKWLANVGSHVGNLTHPDALDGFDLLEFCLDKLYNNREVQLLKLSTGIIKRKGRPSSKV